MSKDNRKLAERIVKQYAQHEVVDVPKVTDDDGNVTVKAHKIHKLALIDVLGFTAATGHEKLEDSTDELVTYIADKLDDGSIVISDSWADDNLEPEA